MYLMDISPRRSQHIGLIFKKSTLYVALSDDLYNTLFQVDVRKFDPMNEGFFFLAFSFSFEE